MGKSSLMVMLAMFHLSKFIRDDFDMALLKVGPDTLDRISEIAHPHRTVLLLDALDEDQEAWEHFYTRLQTLLQATKVFRKVILTCRTQFFPAEYEEDGRVPGQITLSGFHCSKLFLAPFSDEQVSEYLNKRFPIHNDRERALEIVRQMSSLKFRPMLLSYVDFLMEHPRRYDNAYAVYASLVEEWLNRELRKGVISNKNALRDACFSVATYMYKTKAQELDPLKIAALCRDIDTARYLPQMTIEGRSLLHRTSRGDYKFAHYSILEYFVATSLMQGTLIGTDNSDQIISFIADMVAHHDARALTGLDLHRIYLAEAKAPKLKCDKSNLREATLTGASLRGSSFKGADLTAAGLDAADISESSFLETILTGAHFVGANAKRAKLEGALLQGCDGSDADLAHTVLLRVTATGARFERTTFTKSEWSDVEATELKADSSILIESAISRSRLSQSIFSSATALRSRWSDCDLANATFAKAKLNESVFVDCRLPGAIFDEADCSGVTIDHAQARAMFARRTQLSNASIEASDLDGLDIHAAQVDGLRCRRVTFKAATFSGASGSHVAFDNCQCEELIAPGFVATQSAFRTVSLYNAKLTEAVFDSSAFDDVRLTNAALVSASFNGARISDGKFQGADAKHTKWNDANLTNCSFDRALLEGASFRSATIIGCDLTQSRLHGASFRGAHITDVIFKEAKYDSATVWPDGFDYANSGAYGPGVIAKDRTEDQLLLEDTDLSGGTFRAFAVKRASFVRCVLDNTTFDRCSLASARIIGSRALNAAFENCDFTDATFFGCDFRLASFNNCVMSGAKYDGETQFPAGFIPRRFGMTKIGRGVQSTSLN